MNKPIEIIREYRNLIDSLTATIEKTGLKDKFIYEKLEMTKDNYYRRKRKPELWQFEELIKLFEILGQ
jgi:hypothetical protein